MKLLFPSMHGSSAVEVALLCQAAGVELFLPCMNNEVIRTLVVPGDAKGLSSLGATVLFSGEELRRVLPLVDAVMASSPEQVREFHEKAAPLAPQAGLVVRHSLNSFPKYKALGVKNFMTCSRRAADLMGCNAFITRKLVDWRNFGMSACEAEDRHGLDSYVHDYVKKWPKARERLDELNRLLAPSGLVAVNHGRGGTDTPVDDLARMCQSVATIHVKDGNAVCNAVVRSMAVGTPVLMDRLTHEKCFFDGLDGIMVYDTIAEMAAEAAQLAGHPATLEAACAAAHAAARRQFTPDEALGAEFGEFLSTLKR